MSAMTAGSPGFSSPGATALTDVAATELAGEHSCHRLHRRAARRGGGVDRQRRAHSRAGEVDDRSSVTEVPRCLSVTRNAPHVGPLLGIELSRSWSATGSRMTWPAAWTRMSIPAERLDGLYEHPFESSSSATSARDRERGPACGEDVLDVAVGRTLVPDVADDNGVARFASLRTTSRPTLSEPPVTTATRSVQMASW
jgi:hypothetical protein